MPSVGPCRSIRKCYAPGNAGVWKGEKKGRKRKEGEVKMEGGRKGGCEKGERERWREGRKDEGLKKRKKGEKKRIEKEGQENEE